MTNLKLRAKVQDHCCRWLSGSQRWKIMKVGFSWRVHRVIGIWKVLSCICGLLGGCLGIKSFRLRNGMYRRV